jgi:DNA-binding transcriptional ArsR family regulator
MSLFGDMNSVDSSGVWRALADPTRRQLLETLSAGHATTGQLVEQFSSQLARTAVMKHLDILEDAHLISVQRVGRNRVNRIERQPLEQVAGWLKQHVAGHQLNLKRLKSLAES